MKFQSSCLSHLFKVSPCHTSNIFRRFLAPYTQDVCIRKSVKQSHGADIYTLGNYASTDMATSIDHFNQGTQCIIQGKPSQPREVDVKYACNSAPSAQTVIHAIEEPKPCTYSVVIATPLVCSDPSFTVVVAGAPVAVAEVAEKTDGHEDWLLSISETIDGRLVCVARTTEPFDPHQPSLIQFGRASLEFTALGAGERVADSDAMHPGRAPVADSALQRILVAGSRGGGAASGVETAAGFASPLALVQISTG